MILIIQICLILLAALVFWCEYSPFFANTVKSIIVRTLVATSMIGVCYNVKYLTHFNYEFQFISMVVVLVVTFLSVRFILNKYRKNRQIKELKYRMRHKGINHEQH